VTMAISINVGLTNGIKSNFLIIALIKIKLLDIPKEYATSSINPNGEKKRIESGGISPISGAVSAIEAKANPVDQEENNPHTIPNPGINIGRAMVKLCVNIPNASMSKTRSLNSAIKASASSSVTVDSEPTWNKDAKSPRNTKNDTTLSLFTQPYPMNNI